jgi:hypothetical protein
MSGIPIRYAGLAAEGDIPVSAANPLPVTLDSSGIGTEATLLAILAELEAPVTELPHQPLDETSDLTYVFSTGSASGERAALVAAVAAQTTRVHRMVVTAAAATVLELRNGASGTALMTIEFPAAGAYTFDFDSRPWVATSENTALILNSTVATKVTLSLWYVTSA